MSVDSTVKSKSSSDNDNYDEDEMVGHYSYIMYLRSSLLLF